ncbi:bifunctional phosphopantothenoylcysteine decarboxylase/phosphopantothenate--cysteine ligase CoaBC [Methylovorus menthalis]|uniref:bifunctional phosphopantothenoylcysteine decarboxylase/phosphopantothenate--cysteine ligase CoaBC n=1 Tax=Methylovorus menthalis TaxID=1002227 RepID=UPI001E331DD9|nr:bifunctional phosphopantothenoylcysteine decarboxylase/phosphopantothenate--cysteine ligase CoaBC [Methylovorus menthalis]MCB4810234.1 bifunctional phosphopantothenoylcysteine decarboxylase/phosphopantothenate--cysteine ligase CoaBC [Methylovorus menthalis]
MTRPIQHLVVGMTGGIAAYKTAELVRLLVKQGIRVDVVMTSAATRFITPLTMQALSGRPVYTDLWDERIANGMPHIELSRQADAILVAPASADFMAKLVHGAADDLLSTLCLARDCPLIVAPAMNRQMWEHPATQRNVAQLQKDGVRLIGPDSGEQACGETGLGRMLEPQSIVDALQVTCPSNLLAGKRILITAGPTIEAIDPVRGITNFSSGKMGYAIAQTAIEMGADVTLISGPTALAAPHCTTIQVTSAQQMHDAVMAEVIGQDVFIAVAAVADYRPREVQSQKIKKHADTLQLDLVRNPDILAAVTSLPRPPFCVGFAAESGHLLDHAHKKRLQKNVPLLAANLVSEAMGGDDSRIVLIDDQGEHPLPPGSKTMLAHMLLQHMAGMLPPSTTSDASTPE